MAQEDHAVVVGIRAYPGLSDLGGPCDDAVAFRDWLLDPAQGAVPPDKIRLLLTTQFHPPGPTSVDDAHPIQDEVNALFRPFVSQGATQGRLGRRLYIYLAGHGFSDAMDANSAALYAANATPLFAPHVAGTIYAEWFRRNGVFDEIVLVMDCCRTATPIASIIPPPLPNTSQPGQAASVRTFYAYATSWGQAARERALNGGQRGIFTAALIDALRRARPNRYGRVTGQVVKNYVHNNIATVAGDVVVAPPDIRVDSDRDIVLVERAAAPDVPVLVRLAPFAGGEVVVVERGPGDEAARVTAQTSRTEVRLVPGFYKATVLGTARSQLFEVVGDRVEIRL